MAKKVAAARASQFRNPPAMVNGAFSPRRDRTAVACSIAIHCCVLAALATLPRLPVSVDVADERTLLATSIRVEHRTPLRAPRAEHAVAAAPPLAVAAEVPILHVAQTTAHAERAMVVPAERRYRAQALRTAAVRTAPPPGEVATRTAPAVQPAVVPNTQPTASATAAPVTVAEQHEDGIGNFSENYPAQVDPQVRGALFVGVAGSVVLRVDVDETGRVTAISFIRAPADPALKDALRTRLLAMRFIPAACNGLRCSDTIELHN